jgi:hypothetical protein
MDPQEIRGAIAKSQGWEKREDISGCWNNYWKLNGVNQEGGVAPPLYHLRREDIMPLVQAIPEALRGAFLVHLSRGKNWVMITPDQVMEPTHEWAWDILTATPLELAKAYLAAILNLDPVHTPCSPPAP